VSFRLVLAALLLVSLALRDTSRATLRPAPSSPRADAAAVVAALGGPLHVLRGRVEDGAHAPLRGVALEAILVLEGRTYPLGLAHSGPDGTFAIPRLPEGSYWLVARAAGRARRVEPVRIHQGDPAPLTLALGPGATILGSVSRPARRDGTVGSLAGIVVRALPDGGGEGPPYATRTGDDGAFAIEGLPPGSYRVEIAEAGYEPVVRRAVPAPARGLALVLRELASVRGVVRDGNGHPARDAEVLLAGSGVWPPRVTRVRGDGRFEIVGIPSGVYEVRAHDGDLVAEPVAPLVLEPGDGREVTLTVTPGAAIEGLVVDAVTQRPVARARVIVAEDALATAPRALVADEQGRFTVSGLLRRPHQVSARAEGYVPKLGTLVQPGGAPARIALDREVALTGRVVDARGAPVPGAQVEVLTQDLDGRSSWLTASAIAFREALFAAQARGPRPLVPAGELGVMPGPVPRIPLVGPGGGPAGAGLAEAARGYVTDAEGRFRVAEVPPGLVTVVATHPAYVRGETAQRAVRAGEAVELEIVLHPGGTIEGRLLDERGFPVAGQPIEVRAERDPMPRRAFTARDGTFRVPSVLGRLSVVALVGGRVGARAEVQVADDAIVPLTLTLDRNVRRVRGRVLDPRGFPVAGAEVILAAVPRGPGSVRTVSAGDGTFDTVVAGAGPLAIEVRHPEFAPRALRVGDVRDDVVVSLEPGGSVSLEVRAGGCASGDVTVELRTPCGPLRRTLRGGGTVRAEHLCAGRVTAIADAPGCVRAERSGTVGAGGTTELPTVDLVAGGSAEGDVVDARGEPVAGALVALADAPPDAVTGVARTDRLGHFVVGDLPDGDHHVTATHPVLGRSGPAAVRILRGTLARGLRLRFARELAGASGEAARVPLTLVDHEGHPEVRAVLANSAPARAGVQPGDVVLAVQGTAVRTAIEALARLDGPLGDEVTVEVSRDGVPRTVRWVRALERAL
jgi:hypothetical protein